MRKWELTAKDVVITGNVPNDIGLRLEIGDLSNPSLMLYNNKMRYAYVRVRQLPLLETTIPSGGFENYTAINYRAFGEEPPGLFFKTLDLMSGKDKVTVTLVESGVESEEELPLKMSAVQAADFSIYQNWGRFLITCQAPSFSEFNESTNGEKWALPWAFTFADFYLMPILEIIIDKATSSGGTVRSARQVRNEFYLKFSKEFIDIAYNFPMALLTSTNKKVQLIDYFVGKIISLINSPKAKAWLLDKLGAMRLGALIDLLPLGGYWKAIIEFSNLVQQLSDMNCPSRCQFMVELTPRIRPTFRFPEKKDTTLYVPMGRRDECPIEVTLPDGKIFAFSTISAFMVQYPASSSMGSFQESFIADVEAVLADERAYRFSNIVDVSDGNPSLFPGKLTINASQTAGYPVVTVRPTQVSIQDVRPGSPPKRLYFPEGLGAFIKSVSEGREEITLNFEMDSDVWPYVFSRVATAKITVIATEGNVSLEWSGIGDVSTGQTFNLPLKLKCKPYDLNFMDKFSAVADFDSDLQVLTLTRIIVSGSEARPDGPYIYPFKLELRIDGITSDGKPMVEFNPSRQLKAASKARMVTFDKGLLKMGFALQPGRVKIIANLLPINPSEEEKNMQLVEELILNITEGIPTIKVKQTVIEFEDNDKAGVTVTVELPDKESFGTDNVLQTGIEMQDKAMTLSSIVYRPNDNEPPMSPVDLAFTLKDYCGAVFNADSTTHVMNASKAYVGIIKDFLKPISQGDGNLAIGGYIRSNSKVKLSGPKLVLIPIRIAPPAKAILEGLVPGNQPFETVIDLSDGSSLKIWKYNSILLRFRVENHSDKTTVRVLLNGNNYPGAEMKGKTGKTAKFEILIINLKEGTYKIAVEADKVTNFGKPLGQTFVLDCLKPMVNIKEIPPKDTDNKKQTFSAELDNTCNYRLVIKSNSRTIIDKSEDYASSPTSSGQQGHFTILESFELDYGVNTVLLTVSNAFLSYNPVDMTVSGHRPEFYDLKANDIAFDLNLKVKVDIESVNITGRVMYSTHLFADKNPVSLKNDGTFSYKVNLSEEGVNSIVLKASNSFGDTPITLSVELLPIIWVYEFTMDFKPTKNDQRIQVCEYNPAALKARNIKTWDTGLCSGWTKPYRISYEEKKAPPPESVFPYFETMCYDVSNGINSGGGEYYHSIYDGWAIRWRGGRKLEVYQMIGLGHIGNTEVLQSVLPPVLPPAGMVAYISAHIGINKNEWSNTKYREGAKIL